MTSDRDPASRPEDLPTGHILVLEDEPVIAMNTAQAIVSAGYGVCGPFATASLAVEKVKAGGVDAALLDVSLRDGETSGIVADALEAAGVPFAFVTGYGPSTASVVSRFPDRLVIPKPLDAETLALLLAQLVTPQPGARLAG